jgi:hypothetical protein
MPNVFQVFLTEHASYYPIAASAPKTVEPAITAGRKTSIPDLPKTKAHTEYTKAETTTPAIA